jgi:hypothetical protein
MPGHTFSRFTLFTAVALIAAAPAPASDPIGVFAVIDRVLLEPADNPRTIQIWGVFALADKNDRNNYLPPQRGYLYYSLPAQNPRAALAEWSDFTTVAGKNQPLGWGSRYAEQGRVRLASEKVANPDVYQLGFGLVKVMSAGARAGVAQQLLSCASSKTTCGSK